MTNLQVAIHLFLQLAVIVAACRLAGRLLRPLGQSQVVSEMIAGVVLGPSLLGLVAPDVQAWLFPTKLAVAGAEGVMVQHPTMTVLFAMSQVGLVLYMFLIGLELDLKILTDHARGALAVSVAGIALPMAMGGVLGVWMAGDRALFPGEVAWWQAALFVASAMAITAFPMLARILYESGLTGTRLGTLAIGAAAFDDAAAWSLLACVLATFQGSASIAVLAVGGGLAYGLFMATIGRGLLRRLFAGAATQAGTLTAGTMSTLLLVLALCAWLTDWVGIYSIFGAFIAGVCMPRGPFAEATRKSIEPLTVSLLLPLFFVFSGLNTRLDLLVSPALAGVTLLTIAVAFVCKGLGCGLASRAVGASWRESAAIGVLMNARGLMELILANVALERGMISPELFSILVLMAVVTTLAASPLFRAIAGGGRSSRFAREGAGMPVALAVAD